MALRSRRGAIMVAALSLACAPKVAPQPVVAVEAPPPSAPAAWVEPAPPAAVPSGSWAPLLRVVPNARLIVGVDLARLRTIPLWRPEVAKAPAVMGLAMRRVLEAAEVCGVAFADVRRMVFGLSSSDVADMGLALIEAPGIGEQERMGCIGDTGEFKSNGARLEFSEGGAVVPISADVIAVTNAEFLADVDAALASGRAEADPAILPLLDRTDMNAGAWMVGRPESATASPPLDRVERFAVSADPRAGLRVSLWLGVAAADIQRVRDELDKQLEMMKGVLPNLGLSADAMASVQLISSGDGVVLQADFSENDIRAFIEKVRSLN